jgi:formate dehydrogenase major subunit
MLCGARRALEVTQMNVTRRTFIRNAGGAIVASTLGFDVRSAYAQAQELKISKTTETRSTCPYCAVACGVIIHTLGDKARNVTAQVVHVEGDPDCPTNRGTLCPKGSSLYHDILNDRRLLRPEVRRPGSDRWEPIPWDRAFEEIGRHIKSARDESFVATDARGRTVNRCENIAWIGGCTDTNEFNYLVVKTMRSLGLAFIENQARV